MALTVYLLALAMFSSCCYSQMFGNNRLPVDYQNHKPSTPSPRMHPQPAYQRPATTYVEPTSYVADPFPMFNIFDIFGGNGNQGTGYTNANTNYNNNNNYNSNNYNTNDLGFNLGLWSLLGDFNLFEF